METTLVQQEEVNNSEDLLQWYTDMVENYPNTFIHYLSDNATLQWFGRSIRGPDKILHFIRNQMRGTKHVMQGSEQKPEQPKAIKKPMSLAECQFTQANEIQQNKYLTPENSIKTLERVNFKKPDALACGDGPNIDNITPPRNVEIGQGDCKPMHHCSTNYFETSGAVEFCKPCYKRGVSETRWERPCTLKIGYVGCLARIYDFSIQLIVYGDNMTCKRNLLPEFNECLDEML